MGARGARLGAHWPGPRALPGCRAAGCPSIGCAPRGAMAKARGSRHDGHRAGGNDARWGARLRGPRLPSPWWNKRDRPPHGIADKAQAASARDGASRARQRRRLGFQARRGPSEGSHMRSPWGRGAWLMANGAGRPSAGLGRTNTDHRYSGISGGPGPGSGWAGLDPPLPIDRPAGGGRSWPGAECPR